MLCSKGVDALLTLSTFQIRKHDVDVQMCGPQRPHSNIQVPDTPSRRQYSPVSRTIHWSRLVSRLTAGPVYNKMRILRKFRLTAAARVMNYSKINPDVMT